MSIHSLRNFVHPNYIGFTVTNHPKYFQNEMYNRSSSDFYRLKFTYLKIYFPKDKTPKVINCRNYKTFDNNQFRADFLTGTTFFRKDIKSKFLRKDSYR